MAASSAIEVDDVWRKLGSHGKHQIIQLAILVLFTVVLAFNQLSVVFLSYSPKYWCAAPDNATAIKTGFTMLETDKCTMSGVVNDSSGSRNASFSCLNGYEYSQARKTSIVSEWDLVCEKGVFGGFIQTILMCGQTVGCIVFSSLSDTFGRKPVHVICHVAILVVNMLTSFSPHYAMLAVLRFFLGGLLHGAYLPAIVLKLENFPNDYRVTITALSNIGWTAGVMLLAPVAYAFRFESWRYLQLGIAAASLYSLAEYWMLEESIRWLVAKNRIDDAKRIVIKVANINKMDPSDALRLLEDTNLAEDPLPSGDGEMETEVLNYNKQTLVEENGLSDSTNAKGQQLLQIFQHPKLRMYTLCLAFIWIVNACTYYGLFLMSSKLAGDRFVNYLLSGVIELPAIGSYWIVLRYIGRKPTAIIFHAIAGICLIVASILAELGGEANRYATAVTVLVLLGKFGISGSWCTMFLYTPEIYPTNVRNLGLGLASSAARIGAMLAPLSVYLSEIAVLAPGTIFGTCCLITCGVLLAFPETRDKELPQTIEDMTKWEEEAKKEEMTSQRKLRKAVYV